MIKFENENIDIYLIFSVNPKSHQNNVWEVFARVSTYYGEEYVLQSCDIVLKLVFYRIYKIVKAESLSNK